MVEDERERGTISTKNLGQKFNLEGNFIEKRRLLVGVGGTYC
jgi:hypothetical protein